MAVDASTANVRGNYVASSQPGCHIAHHDAEWIIEATDFDLEDYGLEPGEEEGVPDMIVDPDTRSLRCPKRGKFQCWGLGVSCRAIRQWGALVCVCAISCYESANLPLFW